jgi:hypothetical protein
LTRQRENEHGHVFGPTLHCERCGDPYATQAPKCKGSPMCGVCGGVLRKLGHGTVPYCRRCRAYTAPAPVSEPPRPEAA